MEVKLLGWDFEYGAVEGQLLFNFKERVISEACAIRREDTGHVSKLRVKTLFISENLHSYFRSFLCIVRNCNILHLQDVILGHFSKTGVYAGWPLFHFPPPRRWTMSISQR